MILVLLFICLLHGASQPPAGYYLDAEGKTDTELKSALHNIIKAHTPSTYSGLWTHFMSTDANDDGKVWDMYSDKPGQIPPYVYTFITDQCGSYSKEGDCYNREHVFPASWFGGEVMPMYTDLFHIYPTDGYVNNKRANYPFGKVATATWTSLNGSKLGTSGTAGYTGIVFEPVDAYKGDFARSFLYMAVRYYGEDTGWPGSDMFNGAEPKEWAVALLLNWHNADPVSTKEINRNNAVYAIQGNRNPFIDNPAYAELIWGNPNSQWKNIIASHYPVIYPVPAREKVVVSFAENQSGCVNITLISLTGQEILRKVEEDAGQVFLDVSGLHEGIYLLVTETRNEKFVFKLPVIRK